MFNPSRLTLARKRRGLSKKELAESVDISPRMIVDYESGKRSPPESTAAELANALQFPPSFFEAATLEEPNLDAVSFRSMSGLTASQRDRAIASATIGVGLSDWMSKRFRLPESRVPDFGDLDPESAAEAVRSLWNIGERPIRNVLHLLEAHGVRAFSLTDAARELDAFSFWRNGIAYIFLNTTKSGERGRMDAAHELGHLVLHRHGGPQGKGGEQQADRFASAFLMPHGDVLAHAPVVPDVDSLVRLKRKWKVSVAALNYRLHTLGLATDWQYRTACIEIAKRGYRTSEPEGCDRETSLVMQKVFQGLRDEGIGRAEVADALSIGLEELEQLIFNLVMRHLPGGGSPTSGPQDADCRQPPQGRAKSLRLV